MFLLSVFFVVWAFRAVWAGACLIFCCLGGGGCPAQTAKNETRTRPNSTNINTPSTPPSVFFFLLLFGRVGVFFFFGCLGVGRVFVAVWAGGGFFFLLFGWGACCFCCLGGWRVLFFCCLGGCRFFLLFGRVACFFCYLDGWRVFFCCLGGGREFTHLPVCLARL